jgi:uncharacterized protein YbaR (Trm112 family)
VFFELTDVLVCPRCGPEHGLVLLVEEVRDRRVRRGWLGCSNCRTDFPVDEGVAFLSLNSDAERTVRNAFEEDELALKLLALSGLSDRRGVFVLGERLAHVAPRLGQLAPELEVVSIGTSDECDAFENVSQIVCDASWPLVGGRIECVAIAAGGDSERVAMASQRVGSGGRLLLFDAREEDVDEARRSGLDILAAEAGTAVAERRRSSLPIVG